MKQTKAKKDFLCRLFNSDAISTRCKSQCLECSVKQFEQEQTQHEANRVFMFTCTQCNSNTIVKFRDPGTVPFFIDCYHCKQKAVNLMQNVPQTLQPHLIAFKPANQQEWILYQRYLKDFYKPDVLTNKDLSSILETVKSYIEKGGTIMVPAHLLSTN